MIRITTSQVAVGDTIRCMGAKGTVLSIRRTGADRSMVEVDTVYGPSLCSMRDMGTVELLSPLNGRVPARAYGRW